MGLFRRFVRPDLDPAPSTTAASAAQQDAAAAQQDAAAETATVRRIVGRLEALPPDVARYLAAFAYVMSRAASADLDVSAEETSAMERLLIEVGGLDEPQAVLVVEMAKLQSRLQGATEDYLVTREFGRIATDEQKLALLRCCFAVTAADDTIDADEASVVNQIARELDVSREELNAVRAEFNEQLSAIQALRRLNRGAGPEETPERS